MKRNSLSKLLRRIACALAALVIALAVAVFALWHNELTTLASFQKPVSYTHLFFISLRVSAVMRRLPVR